MRHNHFRASAFHYGNVPPEVLRELPPPREWGRRPCRHIPPHHAIGVSRRPYRAGGVRRCDRHHVANGWSATRQGRRSPSSAPDSHPPHTATESTPESHRRMVPRRFPPQCDSDTKRCDRIPADVPRTIAEAARIGPSRNRAATGARWSPSSQAALSPQARRVRGTHTHDPLARPKGCRPDEPISARRGDEPSPTVT